MDVNGEKSATPVLGQVVERLWQWLEAWFARLDRRTRGWLSLLVRTWLAFDQDDGPPQARSISYFTLFSVFPMFLVIVVIASLRLEEQEVYDALLTVVTQYVPLLADLVEANIENMLRARESVGLIALISLIWSASGVFSAVFRAVNRAWGDPKPEVDWSGQLFGLIVTLVVSAVLLVGGALAALRLPRTMECGARDPEAPAAEPAGSTPGVPQSRRPPVGSTPKT